MELELKRAESDLRDAELPGIAGVLFNPIREAILLPIVSATANSFPSQVPSVVDDVGAFTLGAFLNALEFGYGLVPHKSVEDESEEATKVALTKTRFELQRRHDLIYTPNPVKSLTASGYGFAMNTLIDLLTWFHNDKYKEWRTATIQFAAFAIYTGIGKELLNAFFNVRAPSNIGIMSRIQESQDKIHSAHSRRARTEFATLPEGITEATFKELMVSSAAFARYATAAYGVSMMTSSELAQVYGAPVKTVPGVLWGSTTIRRRKIASYVNIEEEDIRYLSPVGGSMDLLPHFVAVDKKRQAVVLAIRGTYSYSGLITDVSGYTRHLSFAILPGFVSNALALYNNDETMNELKKALSENPSFKLVVTGHSLGAGVACLLNIKFYYEGKLPETILPQVVVDPDQGNGLEEKEYLGDMDISTRDISCFAYAPPAPYLMTTNEPEKAMKIGSAMKSTTAFIHENDVVPFLSGDAVRRLAVSLDEVDDITKHMSVFDRVSMAQGDKALPPNIIRTVLNGSRDLPPVSNDTGRTSIPAPFVMWMRKYDKDDDNRDVFDTRFCIPHGSPMTGGKGISELPIKVGPGMITDHMMPNYEASIYSVLQQLIRKDPAYVERWPPLYRPLFQD